VPVLRHCFHLPHRLGILLALGNLPGRTIAHSHQDIEMQAARNRRLHFHSAELPGLSKTVLVQRSLFTFELSFPKGAQHHGELENGSEAQVVSLSPSRPAMDTFA